MSISFYKVGGTLPTNNISLLVLTGTLIFAFIQGSKAERESQKANQANRELINTKKERDRIE
ncbi:MAG: hypothetical protein ACKPCI_28475, partial [Dolichospermum sp.]